MGTWAKAVGVLCVGAMLGCGGEKARHTGNDAGGEPDGSSVADATVDMDASSDVMYGPRVTPGLTSEDNLTVAPEDWATTADGQVVENMEFRSRISILHANVTFRNCRFDVPDQWAWHPADFDEASTSGAHFEHCDFVDALPVFGSADPENPAVITACRMRGSSNGYGDTMKGGSNFVLEDSLLRYEYTPEEGAHSDGIQSDAGSVANIVVRHNQIEVVLPGTANGCLFENEGGPEMGNWLIENNILKTDGGYAVRAPNLNGWGRVTVRNNQIPSTYLYGPLLTNREDLVDWSGNVDENGDPVGE